MKKIVLIVFIILLSIFSFLFFSYKKNSNENHLSYYNQLPQGELEFNVTDYSIFGTHFNIEACIDTILESPILILKKGIEEIEIESNFYNNELKTCFYTSKINNEGIYLDKLKHGNYMLFVKDSNDVYYTLVNNTKYENLEYYTITKNNKNNKININFENINEKNYVSISITESELPEDIYDISIDPGHGGDDCGARNKLNDKEYCEANLNLNVSLLLKQELEKLGLKVILTRDKDVSLESYGENGRAVIANKYKTKYSLSIHFNSSESKVMNYGGVEVYIPNDIDYKLAKLFAEKLSKVVGYSKNKGYKVDKGIYYKYFSQDDIDEFNKNQEEQNQKTFDIILNSSYLYMIRELGGANTYAYRDGRDGMSQLNLYYDSNQTTEPYLLELGYINYRDDLKQAVRNPELFSKAISEAIKEFLNI